MLPFTKRTVNNFSNIPGVKSAAGFVKLFSFVRFFHIHLGVKYNLPTKDSSTKWRKKLHRAHAPLHNLSNTWSKKICGWKISIWNSDSYLLTLGNYKLKHWDAIKHLLEWRQSKHLTIPVADRDAKQENLVGMHFGRLTVFYEAKHRLISNTAACDWAIPASADSSCQPRVYSHSWFSQNLHFTGTKKIRFILWTMLSDAHVHLLKYLLQSFFHCQNTMVTIFNMETYEI